ncbi:MAG: 30S ribosomal protein S21 [Betaproteobacteria bacterium AqS2]|uniref:Small ribosomal subunit protein bS21 n=1 Tax=Candidatus Amphirhobacter heronislandensis TaxID=1732024 RepID=A0A930Y343_9GAMM|nr:30S ribosomal protein S21 [Betaproteobacteria bacterium AqS2]
MPSVTIKEHENFEVAMRRFKRMIDKTNRISDIRSLKHFEKPTTRRKRKKLAAIKRQQRKVRLQRLLFKNTRAR